MLFDCVGGNLQVSGVRSTPAITETIIIGGEDEKIEYQIFCKRSDLGIIPAVGTRVDVYESEGVVSKMRILGVRTSPDDSQLLSLQMGFSRVR